MRLYLVQHGQAKPKTEDAARPLTDRGRSDVQAVAGFLAPSRLKVQAVWQSGKTRAAQTAEALARSIRAEDGVVQVEGLGPNDAVAPLPGRLAEAGGDVMLVGHMPFMARMAGLLLAGDEEAQPVAFQQGGVVCLAQDEDGAWQVAWMIVPELVAAT